ncbi:carboxypeptidase-like regulatory domain-containing protein [Planctomicrobium sp. SH668]|uniref:carboxypeptidase-like regulatory domain-containing protein n=1 Tax=Planctomicrobium sp. SH668 TaxID=3448126 RepID=UPI003F5B7EB8
MLSHRILIAIFMSSLFMAGCSSSVTQVGGVSGKTEADGNPLPAGTGISFYNTASEDVFMTRVDESGNYSYQPVAGVPIAHGKYKVVLAKPPLATIEKEGMTITDPKAKPVKFPVDKKYLSKESTPLEVELGNDAKTFDISI